MTQSFFITSSGTGIGKTLVTATLTHQLLAAGRRVSALKPVISGYDANDAHNDVAVLLASQRLPATVPNVEAISPWRFSAPVAPNVAARREGREVPFGELVDFCTMTRVSEITLIEGAGGVMAPLTDRHTSLDWIETLGCPVILVVGTYLGAISHALSAGEVLLARGIPIQAIVVSASPSPIGGGSGWGHSRQNISELSKDAPLPASPLWGEEAMSVEETARPIRSFLPQARYVVPLPRIVGSDKLWQDTADLTWMLT